MAEVRIEHVFDCSEDTYWNKIFLDEEYNRRLFKEALGFPVYDKLSFKETDTEVKRVLDVVPKVGDLPAAIKKVIGENIGYREEGTLDKKTRRYRSVVTTNKMADKIKIEGVLSTAPAGDNKCKRIFVCTVIGKIFGIGGMIEKRIIADMETSYATSARFTNQYIKEKGL